MIFLFITVFSFYSVAHAAAGSGSRDEETALYFYSCAAREERRNYDSELMGLDVGERTLADGRVITVADSALMRLGVGECIRKIREATLRSRRDRSYIVKENLCIYNEHGKVIWEVVKKRGKKEKITAKNMYRRYN